MSTQLSPENEQYLQNAVSMGLYHDRGEALDKAVELLKRRESLIHEVNRGIEKLERGEGVPFDIEEIKADFHNRGPVRIFVSGEQGTLFADLLGMRSSYRMAKWFRASFQCRIGIVHFFDAS